MRKKPITTLLDRRKFIALTGIATASAWLAVSPIHVAASAFKVRDKTITVGEIMELYIRQLNGGPIANTVDTLKSGSPDLAVTGVVTCMFATIEVIRKAVALGANFIIAHEPTFYNHQDTTKWLEGDEVYKYKRELIEKHHIAIWRNHDYIHSIQPDGVWISLAEKLGWQKYKGAEKRLYELDRPILLGDLIEDVKKKLEIPTVRYNGELSQACRKVLLMPGAAGGTRQIESIRKFMPDVLITGEVSEWETAEYIRDARASSQKLSMIVLGHIASEEWGSKYMLDWVKKNFPGVKASFVRTGASLITG